MPSTDGTTRGKIANLPPDISEPDRVDIICTDSDIARSLQAKANAALELLRDYDNKLDKELEDRKVASMKFQDFLYSQKDLLTQAEHRLEVSFYCFKKIATILLTFNTFDLGTPKPLEGIGEKVRRSQRTRAEHA